MTEFATTRAVVTITDASGSQRLPRGHVRVIAGKAEWSLRRFNRAQIVHTAMCVEVRPEGRRSTLLIMDDEAVWLVRLAGG